MADTILIVAVLLTLAFFVGLAIGCEWTWTRCRSEYVRLHTHNLELARWAMILIRHSQEKGNR